jgi:allantoinase
MSRFDCIIRQASVMTSTGFIQSDLGIAEGIIAGLANPLTGAAEEEIVAPDAWIVPGMIDAHVHFNEPGRTAWEGFATGSAAAAAGGVTTVFDMPLNASPPTLTPEAFELKQACATAHSRIRTRLWGGLVPGNLDQLAPLHASGVVGFKAFLCDSGMADFPGIDPKNLRKGMDRIAKLPGMCLAVHAEDPALLAQLAARAGARDPNDPRTFLEARPIEVELRAIRTVLDLAGETGCPLHIVHVSSADGIELVTKAKSKGLNVTVETCPHYLALTDTDIDRLGVLAKCAPPLRSQGVQDALWESVRRGEVDTIGSDHSPCPPELKFGRPFANAWGGISGIQHTVPLVYSLGLSRMVPPHRLAALLSSAPARRFLGESRLGILEPGAPADLCLLLPGQSRPISREELLDRHRHSPYVGRHVSCKVLRTWVAGKTVFKSTRNFPGEPC